MMSSKRKKSLFYTRSFAVFTLLFTTLIVAVSGIVLYIAPPGRYSHSVDWRVFSVDKESWEAIHINFSLLVIILASLHIYFNWRVLRGYLRRGVAWTVRYRWELAAATVLTALILVGTLLEWPVLSDVVDFGETLKAQIEAQRIQTISNWQALAGLFIALLSFWGLLVVRSLPEKTQVKRPARQ